MMPRVMIVDDNHQNRLVASGFLEDDYELMVVSSGEECLAGIQGFEPDVILLDWMMPGLDGLEVLKRIRGQLIYRNLRVIMLTAKAQPGDITRAWRTGANDYVTKPFEMDELMDAVARQTAEKQRLDGMDEKRRELQEGVRQAQKMEALGSLAGGIAHDFNNILFPIQAFAELLMGHSDPEVTEQATEIKQAAQRAGKLVAQILSFSRQSRDSEKEPVAMKIIVKEVLKLIRASLPADIRIRSSIKAECGMVMADPTSIHQVVMNLCTNAKHAMEEAGGTLTVRLSDITNAEGCSCLELVVADTGCGIPEELHNDVFKPYFTTKPPGKGTGMGLSTVKEIVTDIGGTLEMESRSGEGTSFRMVFPAMDEECVLPDEDPMDVAGGDERILVVDDEPVIVDILEKILTGLGYRVKAFTDSALVPEAVSDETDLLITDMTMPGMTGVALAESIWKIRPQLPVILMTGFSEAIDPALAKEKGIRELLFKPVGRADISAAIRGTLDNAELN
ncbi:MAG: response regulator [Desulfobacterales bacterium]|nr:response regulator [Desulfobacterales bacterium]